MEIPGIASAGQASPQATAGASKAMGKEEFLKLLTAQLKAQNPLNPLDGTAFTAQLAQFSSLEQLTNINTQLKDMVASQVSLQSTMAANLIGKKVGTTGNSFALNGQADLRYSLAGSAAKGSASIYDATGALVRKLDFAAQKAGEQSIHWDGKDKNGAALPPGRYTFTVEAADAGGQAVGATTRAYGTVTGVGLQNNGTYLSIDGGTQVKLGEINEIIGGL